MNEPALFRLVFPLAVLATVIILVRRHRSAGFETEDERRLALAALARKLKLHFDPKSDFELAKQYAFLRWLRHGEISYAYNVFYGRQDKYEVTVFDYTFAADKVNYYWSAFVLKMKTNFPDLLISHQTMETRIAEGLGEAHIAFESAEFSHAFRVRSADKKFAYDVCHPKMMEYLLANRDLTVEIRGPAVALLFEDWLRPNKFERNLSRLIEFRKLLPEFLFAQNV